MVDIINQQNDNCKAKSDEDQMNSQNNYSTCTENLFLKSVNDSWFTSKIITDLYNVNEITYVQ